MDLTRKLTSDDHDAALALYRTLVGDQEIDTSKTRFATLLAHPGTALIGADHAGTLSAMLTLHILPNITQNGRPYALIENVVTARPVRGRGLGRAVMSAAIQRAWDADAYKIMLLTGQDSTTKGFYTALGFLDDQKHGLQLRRVPPRAP
ncbi:GNAT family N-acetyltransferase [uncultured Tateyamaria sp.]|uniref:GNAT family N-acetyltransferase n=1 Tax=uncultured Tateyamaria sp. TaxID=455651 RepID=UPI002603EAE1|nr:GNAT family N-acetyltransferase [uncultured Tateyamaria sp.]